jgi:hypothetical protein
VLVNPYQLAPGGVYGIANIFHWILTAALFVAIALYNCKGDRYGGIWSEKMIFFNV